MAFDNLLAQRQANTGARILQSGVQTLKEDKDTLGILRLDANTIVAHRKLPLVLVALGTDVDGGWRCSAKFDGIAHEVLEYLQQLGGVYQYGWQGRVCHHRAAFFHGDFEIGQCPLQNISAVGGCEGSTTGGHP